MRVLITGGKGMLGSTLAKQWQTMHTIFIADLPEIDILDVDKLSKVFNDFKPEVVVHCVAMTNVDLCEKFQDKATLLNEIATINVAKECQKNNAKLIYISTDYVFSGDKAGELTENDETFPKTIYGKTKLAGENAAIKYCENSIIARVSWLYGSNGPSFLHKMIQLAKENPEREIKVVNDQFGNPTSTIAVANMLTLFLQRKKLTGIFHVTCEGTTSWFNFAKEIFNLTGFNKIKVLPCTTAEFNSLAIRPFNSSLSKEKLKQNGFPSMPFWKNALIDYLTEVNIFNILESQSK